MQCWGNLMHCQRGCQVAQDVFRLNPTPLLLRHLLLQGLPDMFRQRQQGCTQSFPLTVQRRRRWCGGATLCGTDCPRITACARRTQLIHHFSAQCAQCAHGAWVHA
jgi:hypothetical protein